MDNMFANYCISLLFPQFLLGTIVGHVVGEAGGKGDKRPARGDVEHGCYSIIKYSFIVFPRNIFVFVYFLLFLLSLRCLQLL